MSILTEIYDYKIEFVEKQKKLHTQNDIIDKIKNLPSHNLSFSKKLKIINKFYKFFYKFIIC